MIELDLFSSEKLDRSSPELWSQTNVENDASKYVQLFIFHIIFNLYTVDRIKSQTEMHLPNGCPT